MDDYKIIVEQDNSTVVGRYEPPRRDGGSYQSKAHHRLPVAPMAKSIPSLGQAATPAPRAVTAFPSDEQTVYCPTAHRSQKNGKINV